MKTSTKKKKIMGRKTRNRHQHEWIKHSLAVKPYKYSHSHCAICFATRKEDITDFTLREPNLPALYKKWIAEKLKHALKHNTWQTKSEIRAFWADRDEWYKLVLGADIIYRGKVVAKKGDTAWGQYNPARPNVGVMVAIGTPEKVREKLRKEAGRAHYRVRIPALRKLHPHPSWKGELDYTNFRVELKDAKISTR